MKKILEATSMLTLPLALIVTTCTAVDYSETQEDMTAWITNQMQAQAVQSLTLALVDGTQVVWSAGFGMADPVNAIPADADTVYRIASVSKTFTALSAMIEVDRGRLDIDLPATNYVPEFKMLERFTNAATITPRMFLNHQSGIPGHFVPHGDSMAQDFSFADRVMSAFRNEVLIFPPGFTDTYCNNGFTMMEHVFEPISGYGFIDHAATNLFHPLGMTDTTFLYDTNRFDGRLALSVTGTNVFPDEIVNVFASGGIYSTANDMACLIEMLLGMGEFRGARILSAEALETLSAWQGTNLAIVADTRKGLGLDEVAEPVLAYAGRAYWKAGDTACFHAMLEVMPEHGLGAVVLCNGGSAAVQTAHRLLMCALRDKFGLPIPEENVSFPDSPITDQPDPSWDQLTGFYAHSGGLANVTSNQETITLSIVDSEYVFPALIPHANGWFWNPDDGSLQVGFTNVQDKLYLLMRSPATWGWSTSLGGERIEPTTIPDAWQDRTQDEWVPANTWTSSFEWPTDTVKKHTLTSTNGFLVFGRVFIPVSNTEAYPPITGRNDDGTLKVVSTNDIEWLYLSGVYYKPISTIPTLTPPGSADGTLVSDITGWHCIPPGNGTIEVRIESTNSFRLNALDGDFNRLATPQPRPNRFLLQTTGTVYVAVTRGDTSGGDYTLRALRRAVESDHNGDGVTDLSVYDCTSGNWYISNTRSGETIVWAENWGYPTAFPVPGDYDGDGTSDLAVYDNNGNWYIRTTAGELLVWQKTWGFPNTLAVPGDYDGDGTSDLAVYYEQSGSWYICSPSGNPIAWSLQWGGPGLHPVAGDYDGDGTNDLAVYDQANGTWYVCEVAEARRSTHESGRDSTFSPVQFGGPGFYAVAGDYDGNGISDLAVYEQANGLWYIMGIDNTVLTWGQQFGGPDMTPATGDYTGDGIDDIAVYHRPTGMWYVLSRRSATPVKWGELWGSSGMLPANTAR